MAAYGRVVEADLRTVSKVAIVGEAGVLGHLLPQVVHAVEDAGQDVALCDVGMGSQLEGALSHIAVCGEEKRQELGRGLLFAVPLDGHRAVDLAPLCAEL